ncbi:class I SAM-dependent methyltransferase [Chloroflexota bacterium]
MDWCQYYGERPLSLERYVNDIWDHRPFLSEIASIGQEDKEMLEVGSGSGALSIFLSHLGYKIVSIDNDKGVLNAAGQNNARLNGRVAFKKADACNLPFEDNRFDVCFSQGFFEHFDDDNIGKLLKEQLRVANVVVFSVPTFWYPSQDFGDERLIKKEDWLEILSEFKVDKAVYYGSRKETGAKPSQIYFMVTGRVASTASAITVAVLGHHLPEIL